MRYLYLFGVAVLIFLVFIVGWVKFQENYGLFYPTSYSESRLKTLPKEVEFVTFSSEDGIKLTGLLKRGVKNEPVMVLAHGNAGNMIDRIHWFKTAVPDTWSGLILDYRGYGRSDGTPSVQGLKKDIRAASKYALGETNSDSIILHGRSLGVPFVAYASQFISVDALLLESGFPNAGEVAEDILPVPGISYLLSVKLNTVQYLKQSQENQGPTPKYVIHGENDRVLPVQLGQSLYQQAPEPKKWWEVRGAGHNDLTLKTDNIYKQNILEFFKENNLF